MRRFALLVAAAAIIVLPTGAGAHPLGQRPVWFIAPSGDGFRTSWVIAPDDARILGEHLGLGPVAPEAYAEREPFRDYITARLRLRIDGAECAATVGTVTRVPTGYGIPILYACPDGEVLRARSTALVDIDDRYQTLYEARSPAGIARGALTVSSPSADIDLAAAESSPAPDDEPGEDETTLLGRITASLQGSSGAAPLVVAIVLALALGALHALTPGHGKTITAAYMVGAGGTTGQGLALGAIVAVTHALGVVVLGGAAIAADRLLLPAELGPWFEVAAGALILGVAVVLARARPHVHAEPVAPTRRRLVAVGLIGGLIPSPDAIAIVLVAFSLERWTAGAALIVAFSLGLAVVVLGVAVVAARGGAFIRRLGEGRFVRYAPRVAAAVFAVVGAIVLANGLRSV